MGRPTQLCVGHSLVAILDYMRGERELSRSMHSLFTRCDQLPQAPAALSPPLRHSGLCTWTVQQNNPSLFELLSLWCLITAAEGVCRLRVPPLRESGIGMKQLVSGPGVIRCMLPTSVSCFSFSYMQVTWKGTSFP